MTSPIIPLKSNVKARRNVLGLSYPIERLFNCLNIWELDQRISTNLPVPEDVGKYNILLQDAWDNVLPQFLRPNCWERVIREARYCNSREGIWLSWQEPPPVHAVDGNVLPPIPPVSMDPQVQIIKAPPSAFQLVDAPPGTGKTYCLLKRLRYLADGGYTHNLRAEALVLTFSRTAKAEVKSRAAIEFQGLDGTQQPEFRTIDSLAVELLNIANGQSESDHDKRKRILLSVLASDSVALDNVSTRLARYKWIFIDEFQDIIGLNGRTLLRFIELAILGRKTLGTSAEGRLPPGLLVLGDHRQYINFFQLQNIVDPQDKGLVPEAFIDRLRTLLQKYGSQLQTISLQKIYRADSSNDLSLLMSNVRDILDDALRPASQLVTCWVNLVTAIDHSAPIPCDRRGLSNLLRAGPAVDGAVSGRFGVLTRSNASARKFASICMEDGQLRSRVNLVQSPEGMGFPGWLGMLLVDAQGDLANDGVLNNALSNVPGNMKPNLQEAKEYIREAASALGLIKQNQISAVSLLEALDGSDEPSELRLVSDPQGIWISTVHQSKGRQFPDVFLDQSGLLGKQLSGDNRDEQLESIRITYVAATRAMKTIHQASGAEVNSLVDWQSDKLQLSNGGIDDIKYWENWYYSPQTSWDNARNTLWSFFSNSTHLTIRHQAGAWCLVFDNHSIEFNHYYNTMIQQKAQLDGINATFQCRILDIRSRVSDRKVFLLPVLSGCLIKI